MMIRNLGERWTLRLIIITPLVALAMLTVVITSFYIDKMNFYFKANAERYMSEYISGQKRQGEVYVKDINTLAQFIHNNLEADIKVTLDERLKLACNTANTIYDKYHHKLSRHDVQERIIDALSAMSWYGEKNYIFITDYEGNSIVSGSQDLKRRNLSGWEDVDGRAVVLEEIQKVRKYGEGYINTRFRAETGIQTIKVKDFGHYHWFFGSGIHHERTLTKKKKALLKLIKQAPRNGSGYIAIFEKNRPLYISETNSSELSTSVIALMQKHLAEKDGWLELPKESAHVYVKYFEPFNWHIVYGFKKAYFDAMLHQQQQKVRDNFDEEVNFVIIASAIIAFLVGVLTFIVSRRIIVIIEEYRRELDVQELELRELNNSLEERVEKALFAQREKEKMLIQQSKMAAMGDMISMIAHQWRQPLNQMSYVLMNIESAYEYKEMTPKYMDEKVKEGTKLLEYMSHTIDDFKNFFKPDKEESQEQVCEVVEKTISLIKKSLESHKIALKIDYDCDVSLMLYRNELIQVILNLLANAKDALVMADVADPLITVRVQKEEHYVVILVCDNATGVSTSIQEKIFEPYFTTKGEKSGTGLGLYMAKTIVQEHLHGNLSVYNNDDGACFKISLFIRE